MKGFSTLKEMNRPIHFWGLTPIQFTVIVLLGMLTILALVIKQVHPLILIAVIVGITLAFTLILRKVKEYHDKGNPNFMQGLLVKGATPKKIIDNHYFSMILKKK